MKWRSRFYLQSREGETRTCRKFLLVPRCLGTHWYWLCWATISERIVKMDVVGSMEWGCFAWRWCEVDGKEQA